MFSEPVIGVLLNEDGSVEGFMAPSDYGQLPSLGDHAWRGNPFTGVVEQRLFKTPQRLVFAGARVSERSDPRVRMGMPVEDSSACNLHQFCRRYAHHLHLERDPALDLRYSSPGRIRSQHHLQRAVVRHCGTARFAINYDLGEFIYLGGIPESSEMIFNPLFYLCAETSGFIGPWARSQVATVKRIPGYLQRHGFQQREVVLDPPIGNTSPSNNPEVAAG